MRRGRSISWRANPHYCKETRWNGMGWSITFLPKKDVLTSTWKSEHCLKMWQKFEANRTPGTKKIQTKKHVQTELTKCNKANWLHLNKWPYRTKSICSRTKMSLGSQKFPADPFLLDGKGRVTPANLQNERVITNHHKTNEYTSGRVDIYEVYVVFFPFPLKWQKDLG